ncbi:CheR family methyltransferase [Vulgatibacter incomptus]|uniref:Chemotaxis protein methyltransferase CheR n=1 Tax=Vulgatibacter incomptus TaxID=1391653 RepID=A0A0K1PHY0_9BACT|nr:protein-glutamate O-methyltransferase CheR [Vulgatibacter incomptus]AKU93122.1 Chemotaxis protein methyltransferase CheR [Vulgatibacter incomptus]
MKGLEDASGDLELDRLLEEIFRLYHYDFRSYARSSLRRRIAQALAALGTPTVGELLDRVVRDPVAFARLLPCLTIQVSDLFRDPEHWRALREQVLPHLSTYPSLRVWVAGCGAGEEAYTVAILLHEEGLLDRTQIYATDIDARSLEVARNGVYDVDRIRTFSRNYFASGGRASLSDYYSTAYGRAAMSTAIRKRILFSDHSLATDSAFAEVQLVSCRNVLIYFERTLQDRAIDLFADSLCPRGFLGLGSHESLRLCARANEFEPVAGGQRIYRRRASS